MASKRETPLKTENIFDGIAATLPEELFTTLVSAPGLRIERIVSKGHAAPEGEWYDQEQDEWVLLLRGKARLGFEDSRNDLEMTPGDHVLIPAHCRHRVLWTAQDEPTVWLAVHFEAG